MFYIFSLSASRPTTPELLFECHNVSVVSGVFFSRSCPMRMLSQAVVNFIKREDGPTAVEYAVMLSLIIVVCLVAITALGTNASKTFNTVAQQVGTSS